MSETDYLVLQSARRLFEDKSTVEVLANAEKGIWAGDLWDAIELSGLPLGLVEEDAGGFGLSGEEAFGIVRLAGQFTLSVPLVETMLANRLLGLAGLPLAQGPATVALGTEVKVSQSNVNWRITGTARRVPWGRMGEVVLVVEHEERTLLARLDRQGISVIEGANIALEPRDTLNFDCLIPAASLVALPEGMNAREIHAIGAVLRACQMAGAMEQIAEMTVAYAKERVQFGKPIGKFQAIQQNLAILVEQVAAAGAASDMAAQAASGSPINLNAAAAAKIRAGEAASVVAAIAHQVHGAIGFSHEYPLHYLTKRLWSWRDEYGNEAHWSAYLGTALAQSGADGLWAAITAI